MKSAQKKSSDIDAELSFTNKLKKRFFLRFHMSLILTATILTGLLSTKLLLLVQMNNIVIRYPLAVLVSYLAFFLFVKLWLSYLAASGPLDNRDSGGSALSNLPDFSGGGGSSSGSSTFSGGGGTDGGAGATGVFDGPMPIAQEGLVQSSSGAADSSSGITGSVGDAVSGIFDDDGLILLVLGVLLAAIFGSAIYLIYLAPHILSEAAFNLLLASGLIRGYKKVTDPDWIGSVLKDTYKPFLVVLVIALAAAWIIHGQYPHLTKISELLVQK